MEPTSFDVLETIGFPVVGGIIAGTIVVAIELGFRIVFQKWQRRNAKKAIGAFFKQWKCTIDTAEALYHAPSGRNFSKEDIQFVRHRDFLRQFPIRLDRWSKFLSEEETEQIALYVTGHDNAYLRDLLPGRNLTQPIYDGFFSEAKNIKWLKF